MKFFLANRTSGRIIAYPAVVFLSIASFTAAALGADANGRDQSRSAFEGDCNCKVRSDLKYKNAASYAALDIYYREDGTGKPVLLFIHGGGWVTGDKSNITRNPDMLRSFLR